MKATEKNVIQCISYYLMICLEFKSPLLKYEYCDYSCWEQRSPYLFVIEMWVENEEEDKLKQKKKKKKGSKKDVK